MAQKKFFVDINLNKNQLIDAVLHNTTAGAASGTAVSGQIIFDTGDAKLKYWNGSGWQSAETRLEGALQYKGTIAHDASAVSSPSTGDLYIFSSAGTATNFGGTVVQAGDFAVYNGSGWDIIQGNVVAATDSVAGIVELATNAETITGSDTTRAVTPANLTAWQNQTDKTVVRKKVFSSQAISTTGTDLTHSLDSNDVQVQVYNSSSEIIEVNVVKATGKVTLTSNSNLTNCTVVVSG